MSNPSESTPRAVPRPQRSSENDDITWLDFLRTAGNTVPDEDWATTSNSERKRRRHAGSSPERRGYPYPDPIITGRRSSGMSAAELAGTSRDAAIDLTTPPRQPRPAMPQRVTENASNESVRAVRGGVRGNMPSSMRVRNLERTESNDIVLPKWQPDADVNKCPVCQTEFHFFYRKHHCRKCGRVVCAACSPHRITIPKQYIVQPPTSSDGEQVPTSPSSTPFGRNLGGGEVVRVCNPCVPDPWTPDTTSDTHPRQQTESNRRRESTDAAPLPDRFRYGIPPPPPFQDSGRARSQSHQPVTTQFSRRIQNQFTGMAGRDQYNRPPPPPPPPSSSRPTGHRYTQSNNNASLPHSLPHGPYNPHSQPPPPAVPRPRRQIREEDECPVCGTELPPGDNFREMHIQDCISLRFATGSPPPPPLPRTSTAANANPYNHTASTSVPSTSAITAAASSRPRATSYRPRGMAVYRATEKDCVNEDGEAVECVICFEEFQPGDEMGRMECLCKFHRTCIRTWWDTKGVGSCPTHQLHE